MRKYDFRKQLQLPLIDVVKEEKTKPAKRVYIVSLKIVRESSMLYKEWKVTLPDDAYNLLKLMLVDSDREQFAVVCLDTKNQPTVLNVRNGKSIKISRRKSQSF